MTETDYAKMQREIFEAGEKVGQRFTSGVDAEFFPLDYMPDPQPNLDKSAVDTRTKIDLLKSYIDDVSKAEKIARQKSFLSDQARYADLTWVASELNGTLAHLSEDSEYDVVVARVRLRNIVSKLKKKIEET